MADYGRRDDIALLKEQIAQLEALAVAQKNYGTGVKKDEEGRQDRAKEYNKTLDEIQKKEKEIIGFKQKKGSTKQLTDLQKGYGDGILEQLGIQSSVEVLKQKAKSTDAEEVRQAQEISNILDKVLKGEMDHLDVQKASVGLTGSFREMAEEFEDIAKSLRV